MSVVIRPAAVAGTWYPSEPGALAEEVAGFLDAARVPRVPGRLIGLVSPHAGLRYSGPVAAHAYKLLWGRTGVTFLLVGPSHRMAFHGVAVFAAGVFETPLGQIPVDADLARRIVAGHSLVASEPLPHLDEHSLEMQLPFLQHMVSDLKIVPMLMGAQTRDEVEALSGAIIGAVKGRRDVVVVASSDLSHYHPASEAGQLDARVVEDVGRFDDEALMSRLESSGEHACGGGPMVVAMKVARAMGATRSTVLRYADSGDVPGGDKRQVVGYMAAAFTEAGS